MLLPRRADPGDRLRNDRHDLRPQFDAELNRLLGPQRIGSASNAQQFPVGVSQPDDALIGVVVTGDLDSVGIVGQRFRKPCDNDSRTVAKAQETGRDTNLVPFVERPIAAGTLDRNRRQSRSINLLAAVETEGQLGWRLSQDVLLGQSKVFATVG